MAAGRWTDALAVLQHVQEWFPEEGATLTAHALSGKGDRDAAIAQLKWSIEAWPVSTRRRQWLLMMAGYLRGGGKWSDAESAYRQLLDDPDRGIEEQALVGLARTLVYAGTDVEKAESYARQAIELAPDSADAHAAMGEVLRVEKRHSEAEAWFDQAMAMTPADVTVTEKAVANLIDEGKLDLAEQILGRTIERFPAEPYLHYQLGQIRRGQNRLSEALSEIERGGEMHGWRSPEYSFAAGQVCERLGRTEEALGWYRRALEVAPSYAPAQDRLATLAVGGDGGANR